MKNYPLKTIAACLSVLWCSLSLWAADTGAEADKVTVDAIVVHGKRLTTDQKARRSNTVKTFPTLIWAKNTSNATVPMPPAMCLKV